MKTIAHPVSALGRELSDATLRLHQAISHRAGLTGTDHKYLGILTRLGPMTAGELGRHSGLSTGAVTALIDRLESKKLVARKADRSDRRKVLVLPRAANIQKLLGQSSAKIEQRIISHIKTLSSRDAEVVARYLRETIVILDELSTTFLKAEGPRVERN
jgi:DNA-binding MarR family transcriptional regulator